MELTAKELFNQSYDPADPYWILKCYFGRMYEEGNFINCVESIVQKESFCVDGAYCNFPDMNSYYEEEHFVGVEFAYGYPAAEDETIIVSEEVCFNYVRMLCEIYLKVHSDKTEIIKRLLACIPD